MALDIKSLLEELEALISEARDRPTKRNKQFRNIPQALRGRVPAERTARMQLAPEKEAFAKKGEGKKKGGKYLEKALRRARMERKGKVRFSPKEREELGRGAEQTAAQERLRRQGLISLSPKDKAGLLKGAKELQARVGGQAAKEARAQMRRERKARAAKEHRKHREQRMASGTKHYPFKHADRLGLGPDGKYHYKASKFPWKCVCRDMPSCPKKGADRAAAKKRGEKGAAVPRALEAFRKARGR